MNRLSALDASFIYGETSETPMNVGSLAIFAPPANPDGVFARFRDHTAARLDLLPLYRRRLEMMPLGLDHPAWVDDDDLDLDYHIHRAALPKPGTMKQLRALVARLHAIPLDHNRPLWQYYLIEGLKDGGFAVYFKFHHCDMDGVAHMATLDAMYDFLPNSAPAPPLRKAIDARSCRRGLRRRWYADIERIDADRIGDVLELGWAEIADLEIESRLDLPEGVVGDTNPSGLGDPLQARGDIDAVAHQVAVALLHDVAEMDAHPKFDALVGRDPSVALDHRSLDFNGAVHRVDDTPELDN